jgi:hypothetical protein
MKIYLYHRTERGLKKLKRLKKKKKKRVKNKGKKDLIGMNTHKYIQTLLKTTKTS